MIDLHEQETALHCRCTCPNMLQNADLA